MKLIGLMSSAVLSLTLVAVAPAYAQQEQHEQQDEQKAKPAQHEEKKSQSEKPAKQEQKGAQREEKINTQNNRLEDKNTRQEHAQQGKAEPRAQQAHGRIPDDRFRASFGREHRFHVSQSDYRDRRFLYGGYWFGFVDSWPSNWLYTQDVFVVDIDGVYYLCNPAYPGVNIALSVTM